jgi:beta-N-acetylhexosaminidase
MSLRDLRRHVGRFAVVGFDGPAVPDSLRDLAALFDLAGVIYFARNVVDPRQVADLSRDVAALARDWPFWISVDQEGGRVARFKSPFTVWPPAATLGRSGSDDLAARFAAALAAELAAVGVNLDYAPVLDIHSNPSNRVIGDRALADRAEDVARLGTAVIRSLQAAGVAACGKHFPGHGDTTVDSHEALPVVEHEKRRLEAVEFLPFRRAMAADVAALMTAHIVVPAVDPDRPATLSPRVVQQILKDAMGFTGVVFSDDLGMKAISRETPLPEATVQAVVAGCDVVLLCNSTADEQAAALEALIHAAESGRIAQTRIDDAMARQERVKARFLRRRPAAPPALDLVGCDAHQAVAREMAGWA